VDADGDVTLADALIVTRILARIMDESLICIASDVNGDRRIGLAELMYILQEVSRIPDQAPGP
jgi:hypothetical protein